MVKKQEPRPAYHRRNDVRRLQEMALQLPVMVVDAGQHYEVRLPHSELIPSEYTLLQRGRFEVVVAYLKGWTDAREQVAR